MGRFLVIFFLFFSLSLCFSQEANDPYSWDFGQVKEGVVLKHDFLFRNESDKTLKITDITTSCGCTVSEVKKKVIPPGEETQIKVSFKTKGYSGPTQQIVYVHTDNLDNSILRFIIKADIIKNKQGGK